MNKQEPKDNEKIADSIVYKFSGSYEDDYFLKGNPDRLADAIQEALDEKDKEIENLKGEKFNMDVQINDLSEEIEHLKESRSKWAKQSSENADQVDNLNEQLAKQVFDSVDKQEALEKVLESTKKAYELLRHGPEGESAPPDWGSIILATKELNHALAEYEDSQHSVCSICRQRHKDDDRHPCE